MGFIIAVLRESGAVADEFCDDVPDYQVSPRGPFVRRQVAARATQLSEPIDGALVLLRVVENGWPSQLAMFADRSRSLILAVPKHGVIERRINRKVRRLLTTFWALPGVVYVNEKAPLTAGGADGGLFPRRQTLLCP